MPLKKSSEFEAKRSRVRRLPVIIQPLFDAILKKDAVGVIKTFQNGIREKQFRLARLKPDTIKAKRRKGSPKPDTPLYDRGDEEENSYINMWRLVKMKRGWRVRPRDAKHHSRRIKLKDLFKVHEEGAVIDTGKAVVTIPARPAWKKAQQKYLKKRLEDEPSEEVRKAIRAVIREGSAKPVKRFVSKTKQESRDHENRR